MVDLNETPCVGLRREKGAQADGLRGREGRQNTLTSSLYFKIQQVLMEHIRQDTASPPRMICVIARLRCVLNPGFHFLLLSVIC